jgi:hypothetical protein
MIENGEKIIPILIEKTNRIDNVSVDGGLNYNTKKMRICFDLDNT